MVGRARLPSKRVCVDANPRGGIVLRVATCNPQHGVGRFGLVWHRGLVDTCRSLDADILALQELDRHVVRSYFRDQPALVGRALAMRHVAAPAKRTPVGGTQCNALCARGDIDEFETIELPGRAGEERRIALLARVRLAGATVSVACTHLQHRGGGAREQLAATLEMLVGRPAPRVVAGDFNLDPPDVEPILADRGFTAAPSGPTSPARAPRRRIDWIAVDAGLRVLGTRVHDPVVGDHCPLVADLAVVPPA
jgi:endonuclease/exonuclease/phosphatase family metal-dependent hydrolase